MDDCSMCGLPVFYGTPIAWDEELNPVHQLCMVRDQEMERAHMQEVGLLPVEGRQWLQ
jgi:hypothetical protein